MRRRRRDPRQARLLSRKTVGWILRHRAYTRHHLLSYLRLVRLRLTHPEVVLEGLVFLGRGVRVAGRPGYGRVILGPWVHVGDHTSLLAHEGTLRVGEKAVFGRHDTVTCYLDVEIGASTLVADAVYVTDFDHRTDDAAVPIKDQGIVKSPVRIGPDCWLGVKSTVLRGTVLGRGCVVGANAVVRGTAADGSVLVGVPARPVRSRWGDREPAPVRPSKGMPNR